jgi:hypothetical protein
MVGLSASCSLKKRSVTIARVSGSACIPHCITISVRHPCRLKTDIRGADTAEDELLLAAFTASSTIAHVLQHDHIILGVVIRGAGDIQEPSNLATRGVCIKTKDGVDGAPYSCSLS